MEIITSTKSILNQWISAQDKIFDHFMGLMTKEDDDEHWTLPVVDTIKIYIDAVIFEIPSSYSFH